MPRLGLRAKLLASFVLILLPILGLLIYSYRDAYERRVDAVLADQARTAQAIGALVDAGFDEAVTLGLALSNDPLVHTFDKSRLDPYLTMLGAFYPQYFALTVVNASGDPVGNSIPISPGASAADRPYFRQLMATGQPVVSPVLVARGVDPPTAIIVVAVPIRGAAGTTVGAVLVPLQLQALSSELELLTLSPEENALLVDKAGMAAVYTALPDLVWEQRDLRDFEPVRAALEGRPTTLRRFTSPLLNDTRIGAFTLSPKYGWVVGVSLREDVALAPINEVLRDQLLGLGVIATLSAGLILLLAYVLLQPIRRLSDQAQAVGEGDLSRRVVIKTGDEMEKLGAAFNEMTARLERTLRDLRAVLDATESGILMYDRDLVVRLANRRLAEWFGLDASKIVGQPVNAVASELIAPMLTDPQKQRARIDWLAEHPDETIREVVEVAVPEYRLLRLYVGPVRVDGERIGYIEVYTDITDLSRRQEEREALGQVAAALVRETALERVADIIVEQGQRVLRANSVALLATDPPREELRLIAHRGLSAESITQLSSLAFDAHVLSARAARTGRPQGVPDVLAVGSSLSVSRAMALRDGQRGLFAQPLFAKGRLVGVLSLAKAVPHEFSQWERELIGAFGDLCAAAVENARLYAELREMLELREEFISAAAHELKTPVTTIKGYAQAMRKWAPQGHEPREGLALEVIDRQCDRISRRVQEMLEGVRLRRSPPEKHRVRFDLGDLALEVVNRVRTTTQHGLVLQREAPAAVEADRERVEEVMVSLLDNAIKFSPDGKDVEARVFTQGREVVFAVKDSGTGIARERQPHIFEPFYEAAPVGAPGYSGVAALSLYLSKLTIELHKGRIWFESEEGRGSTFYFSLPVAKPDDNGRP